MPTADILRDIWSHHAWADAEHWRAFEAFPIVFQDSALFSRLHHLHLTQHAWVWALGDRREAFVFTTPGDFTAEALKAFARDKHQALALISTAGESELERRVGIPWLKDPPLQLSVCEGLMQVAMHSHYHRAQNATRFRELGGDPPGTDLITWIWNGRPAARWST